MTKPCLLINLKNNSMETENEVFICLDCFNGSYPEPFYEVKVLPFEEDTPIYHDSICEVCNEYVHRI